jgi:hypothetical protein
VLTISSFLIIFTKHILRLIVGSISRTLTTTTKLTQLPQLLVFRFVALASSLIHPTHLKLEAISPATFVLHHLTNRSLHQSSSVPRCVPPGNFSAVVPKEPCIPVSLMVAIEDVRMDIHLLSSEAALHVRCSSGILARSLHVCPPRAGVFGCDSGSFSIDYLLGQQIG